MDFDVVKEALAPFSELESPSFVQGVLAGLLCADAELEEGAWIKRLLMDAEIKSIKESFLTSLHSVYLATESGLNGSGFEFTLCLPDDEEALPYRAEMLGQWAEGFLYGFGLIGRNDKDIPKEVSEFLNDLGDISRIDIADLGDGKSTEGDNEAEADLMEITEFVRIGVLLCNELLNPTEAPPLMDDSGPSDDEPIQ